MSTTQNQNAPDQAEPLQIGTTPGETQSLIEEIGGSGVASSPEQVEAEGVLERDHNANRDGQAPFPIITSG